MKNLRLSLFLFVSLACVFSLTHAQVPSSQVSALKDLYAYLGGDKWTNNNNWNSGDPCSNHWFGVSCNSSNVVGLYLGLNNLAGSMPSSINSLSSLQTINLSANGITSLSSSLFYIYGLKSVDLSNNKISGSLSSFTQSFAQTITYFNISNNAFSGVLPALSGFSVLQSFDIHNNQFTGSSLTTLPSLSSLKTLDVSSNAFSGSLPSNFQYLPNIVYLNVSYNGFMGSFFNVYSLSAIQVFDASHNQLSNYFPTGFEKSISLKTLDLSYNQLLGAVPDFYSPSTYSSLALTTLNLSNNRFYDSLPSITAPNLKTLDFSANDFYGYIPSSYGSLLALEYFNVGDNDINGDSSSFYSMSYIKYYNVSHNSFYDSLSSSVVALSSLEVFDCSFNQFYSGLPSSYGYNLRFADFSSNNFTGSFPSNVLSGSNLVHLNVSHNQLTYELPGYSVSPSKLSSLDASHNELSGEIPSTLNDFPFETLLLQYNSFSGQLPDFLQVNPSIKTFNASHNLFDCPLPSWCDAKNGGNGACFPCNSYTNWWLIGGILFGVGFLVVTFLIVGISALAHYRKKQAMVQSLSDYNTITQDPNFASSFPTESSTFGAAPTTVTYVSPGGSFNNGHTYAQGSTTYQQ
eukprot:CAMPEP_0184332784 /NCGR_PEP_ID=MMETSP1089-20130417/1926_1 /TAXON_ID=38269 ORGANISM="Gloeochaete wittrockiana, Strain SAG46.84" /NCGR_SAMPLE_ID=MMETSP1089 /ASSEMBLY_ACC=CAM_ASM_000445 /LENGTH=628 /DNA_ID=CAMNT_0026656321 /DNA_START=70 /DNA_END=1956 /DNA_ORIENTATION=+